MYRQTHLHYIRFVGLFCRTPIYVITQLPSVNNSNICLILLLMSRKNSESVGDNDVDIRLFDQDRNHLASYHLTNAR